MQYFFVLHFVICFIAVSQADTQPEDFYTTELVQVLFRHGDRTPDHFECYPNDPYKTNDFKPYGRGHLTDAGKARASHLGKLLRNSYDKLLGDYRPGDVYAYSTASSRTKMTLQWVLESLYPTKPADQVIPTHSNPPNSDHFFLTLSSPIFKELLNQTKQLPEVQKELESYQKFFDHLSSKTGLNVTLEYAMLIYSTLRAQKSYGLELPDWCTDEISAKLDNIVNLFYKLFTYTVDMKKIAIGPLLKELLSNISNPDSKKIVLYSVHDLNIMIFIRGHGIQSKVDLDYGVSVIVEKLRGKDDQIYIRIKFYPGSGDKFTVLSLNDKDEIYSYSKYLEFVNSLVPSDNELQSFYKNSVITPANVFLTNHC